MHHHTGSSTTSFLPTLARLKRAALILLATHYSLLATAAETTGNSTIDTAPPPPTTITSTKLEMWSTDTETHAIFDGNVTAEGNGINITCDRLEIVAVSIAEKDSTLNTLEKFKSLVATGKVHIVQGDREVTCGRAEILPRDDKLTLTESPVVIDKTGPYIATGTRIILLRGEKRIFGDNIKTTLPPIKGNFGDALEKSTGNSTTNNTTITPDTGNSTTTAPIIQPAP